MKPTQAQISTKDSRQFDADRKAMTAPTQAQIERPIWETICLAYQGDTKPCDTPCLHCDRIAIALTAAAEAEEKPEFGFGPPETAAAEAGDEQWGDNTHKLLGEMIEQIKTMQRENTAATIERCAQVADNTTYMSGAHIAAAIRALKEKP